MSQLFVDNIKNRTGGAVGFPTGVVVTGVATFNNQVSIAGTLSYEDVTNVDSTGIVTAKSGIKVTGGEILVGSGFSVGQAGIVTASGGSFTGDVDITDKIVHTGDTNTAIRFPAADTFTVETAGSERVRVTGIGSVGIGENDPANELVVKTSGSPTIEINGQGRVASLTLGVTASESKLFEGSNNDLAFGTNNTERLRITSGGAVGIGTDNPSNYGASVKLALHNTGNSVLSIVAGSSSDSSILFADGTSGDATYRGNIKYAHNGDSMRFHTAAAERLRITSTGGVHFSNAELIERVSIVANKLSAVPNVNLDNGMVHYYTTNETTTATPNIISTAGINTNMATGDTMSVTIMSKPNNAGYFPKVSIDGVATGITTYWSGGDAPSSAESSGVDVNVYQIIKTADATYDVLANTSNFA